MILVSATYSMPMLYKDVEAQEHFANGYLVAGKHQVLQLALLTLALPSLNVRQLLTEWMAGQVCFIALIPMQALAQLAPE
jgi:hypothetical protein